MSAAERAWSWIVLVGGVMMALGAMLPWVRFEDAEGAREVAGYHIGLGRAMIGLGLATAAMPFLRARRRVRLAAALAGAAVGLLVTGHFASVFVGEYQEIMEDILRAEYGPTYGLAVSAGGAALALAGCGWAFWRGDAGVAVGEA